MIVRSLSIAVALLALTASAARAEDQVLTESGSTLIYPLFNIWAADYPKTHADVKVTAEASGSGAGIERAISGGVLIGVSDAYMSDGEVQRNPQILNIPLAISAQTINYNIPALNDAHLKLDGPTLADIYSGKIRTWDSPEIVALNSDAKSKLPHENIVVLRRGDASGDTFIFSQYLTFTTPSWEADTGYGTTVKWPSALAATDVSGNPEMVAKLHDTPNSIGYVGVSFTDAIAKAGLGTAALKSFSGEYLLPTSDTIAAAAAGLGARTPADERLTLVNAPGANAYPLINYEYAVVSRKQPTAMTATALRKFLLWAIAPDESNDKYLADAHFIPLPAHIWALSHDQIDEIK